VPLVGICLGSQMIAHMLGAQVGYHADGHVSVSMNWRRARLWRDLSQPLVRCNSSGSYTTDPAAMAGRIWRHDRKARHDPVEPARCRSRPGMRISWMGGLGPRSELLRLLDPARRVADGLRIEPVARIFLDRVGIAPRHPLDEAQRRARRERPACGREIGAGGDRNLVLHPGDPETERSGRRSAAIRGCRPPSAGAWRASNQISSSAAGMPPRRRSRRTRQALRRAVAEDAAGSPAGRRGRATGFPPSAGRRPVSVPDGRTRRCCRSSPCAAHRCRIPGCAPASALFQQRQRLAQRADGDAEMAGEFGFRRQARAVRPDAGRDFPAQQLADLQIERQAAAFGLLLVNLSPGRRHDISGTVNRLSSGINSFTIDIHVSTCAGESRRLARGREEAE
jgi:hypothetical protein